MRNIYIFREVYMGLFIIIGIGLILGFIFFGLVIRGSVLAGEPFACPNCGYHFYAKWYQLIFGQGYTIRAFGQARIKCPKCKILDMCGRPKS